jgi:hypothetical protein
MSDCLFRVLYVKGRVIRSVREVSCICLTVCLGIICKRRSYKVR